MPLLACGSLPVPTAGTKVAVASVIPVATWEPTINGRPFKAHGIMFQAFDDNVGAVTIFQLQGATYVPVAVLAAPTANFIPSFSCALTAGANSIRIDDLYLDAAQSGEGALVTILVS